MQASDPLVVGGFSNSDLVNDLNTRKSITGLCLMELLRECHDDNLLLINGRGRVRGGMLSDHGGTGNA